MEDVRTPDGKQVGVALNLLVGKISKHTAVEPRVSDRQLPDGDVLIRQSSLHLSAVLQWPPHCDCVWPPVFERTVEHFFQLHELLVEVHPRKALNAAGTCSRRTPQRDTAARLTVQHHGLGG